MKRHSSKETNKKPYVAKTKKKINFRHIIQQSCSILFNCSILMMIFSFVLFVWTFSVFSIQLGLSAFALWLCAAMFVC